MLVKDVKIITMNYRESMISWGKKLLITKRDETLKNACKRCENYYNEIPLFHDPMEKERVTTTFGCVKCGFDEVHTPLLRVHMQRKHARFTSTCRDCDNIISCTMYSHMWRL